MAVVNTDRTGTANSSNKVATSNLLVNTATVKDVPNADAAVANNRQ